MALWLAALVSTLTVAQAPVPGTDRITRSFPIDHAGEARAIVSAACGRCDWGVDGREAVALRLTLDGKYSQHIVLARGEATTYRITLGFLTEGTHRLDVERDAELSAAGAGPATFNLVRIETLVPGTSDDFIAQAMAPILYARPNTIGRFTDLPLFMWYEVVPTPRGRQYRYSVIFSNEDGGTPTDRLMATWGRTTDIEFVYGVELDDQHRVLAEEFQGPGHEVPAFKGRHETGHPLEWVSTDNNMVSESGTTTIRYAPAPVRFDLTDVSREAVMDAHPWLYAVMAQELAREGKIVADAPPGNKQIPDPRRFVFIEACGEVGNAALAFAVNAGDRWIPSDRGLPQYRVVRDGCFRVATPLPAGVNARDIRAIRAQVFARLAESGKEAPAPGPVRLMRINKVFMLDERYIPGKTLLEWMGPATLTAGGPPFEVRIP